MVEFSLPRQYDLVVGDAFELFYSGILPLYSLEGLHILAVCDMGAAFRRKFTVTPAQSQLGDHTLTLTAYDRYGEVVAQGSVILRVKAPMEDLKTPVNVLCFGDSLTVGGEWVDEFCRRLGQDQVRFVGNKKSPLLGAGYEGHGGWNYDHYLAQNSGETAWWLVVPDHGKEAADQESVYVDENGQTWRLETLGRDCLMVKAEGSCPLPLAPTGVLRYKTGGLSRRDIVYENAMFSENNPFCIGGQVDLAAYCRQQGVESLDCCYILLGYNSYATDPEEYRTSVVTFLDKFLDAFPRCRVVLMGVQCPSEDGCAFSYGADEVLNFHRLHGLVFRLDRLYRSLAEDYSAKGFDMQFLQLAGQFDRDYGYPSMKLSVNVRTEGVKQVICNATHPKLAGYHQIADAVFRHFNNNHPEK